MEPTISDDIDIDDIAGCRTCSVHYSKSMNVLRNIFSTNVVDPEIYQIRMELGAWNLQISEDDGMSPYICTYCINEFKRIFKFRNICMESFKQFQYYRNQRQMNLNIIKTEIKETNEQKACGFIYVDELSDDENDACSASAPGFNMPHMPIKDENFEKSRVPMSIELLPTAKQSETDHILPTQAYVDKQNIKAQNDGLQYLSSPQNTASEVNDVIKFSYNDDAIYIENVKEELDAGYEEETEVACKLCLQVATNKIELRQHMERIHQVKNFSCHICGKLFKNSTAKRFTFHLKWHKLNKHIKCAQCGFYCTSRDTLNEHKRAIHSKIRCNVCSKSVLAKKLKAHLREHDLSGLTVKCNLCSKLFETELQCRKHYMLKHKDFVDNEEEIPLVQCAFCAKILIDTEALQLHVSEEHVQNRTEDIKTMTATNHLKEHSDSCSGNICTIAQTNIGNLSEDWDNSITDTTTTTNRVESITENIQFNDLSLLSLNDKSNKSKISEINSFDFDYIDDDDKSNNSDEMLRTYSCARCTMEFFTINDLCVHSKSHEQLLLNCHICGKSFNLKFKLNQHLKKHNTSF